MTILKSNKSCVRRGTAFTLAIAAFCFSTLPVAAETVEASLQSPETPTALTVTPIEPPIVADTLLPEQTDASALVQPVQAVESSEVPESASTPPAVTEPANSVALAYPAVNEPIIIDNDVERAKEQPPMPKPANAWREVPDAPGNVHIATGVRFPIVSISSLSSKSASVGDRVEARLKVDLKIGGRLIAPAGTLVVGHVSSAHKARRLLIAEVALKRWMRANGALGITFDEIVTNGGEHLPLVAKPARQVRIVKNVNEGRVMGVNHNGEIAAPLSTQLKHQGTHLAIRGAAAVGGVFTMGAVPVVFGVLGAMHPSFAFMHPVGKNVPHRRLKGFGMGVLSGLPGGFVVADFLIRGVEAQVKPGDEFLVELHQHFTGEPSTSAQLVPGATKNVSGQVMNKKKSRKAVEATP